MLWLAGVSPFHNMLLLLVTKELPFLDRLWAARALRHLALSHGTWCRSVFDWTMSNSKLVWTSLDLVVPIGEHSSCCLDGPTCLKTLIPLANWLCVILKANLMFSSRSCAAHHHGAIGSFLHHSPEALGDIALLVLINWFGWVCTRLPNSLLGLGRYLPTCKDWGVVALGDGARLPIHVQAIWLHHRRNASSSFQLWLTNWLACNLVIRLIFDRPSWPTPLAIYSLDCLVFLGAGSAYLLSVPLDNFFRSWSNVRSFCCIPFDLNWRGVLFDEAILVLSLRISWYLVSVKLGDRTSMLGLYSSLSLDLRLQNGQFVLVREDTISFYNFIWL